MEEAINVLVVCSRTVVDAGLRALLAGQPGLRLVSQVATLADAVVILDRSPGTVAVLDAALLTGRRWGRGQDLLHRPEVAGRIVVIGPLSPRRWLELVLRLGVGGYVWDGDPSEEFAQAVRAVAAGHTWRSGSLGRQSVDADDDGAPADLAPRQIEVLRLIADGRSDRAIAKELGISTRTVTEHASEARSRLGAANRCQAVALAAELGLLGE